MAIAPPAAVSWTTGLDLTFALLVIAAIATWMVITADYGFRSDDWRLVSRGGDVADYFRPYNGHLSTGFIALYKAQVGIWGLRSVTPIRLISMVAQAAVPIAAYLFARRRLGAAPALVAATALLWYPDPRLTIAQVNFFLALAATVVCGAFLTSAARRADLVVASALTFGLLCSGVAVAGSAGAIAYVFLGRSTARRRLAVLGPSVAWFVWWVTAGGSGGSAEPSLRAVARYASDGMVASFRGLVLGNGPAGTLAMVAFAGLLAWQLRNGPRGARAMLAWTGALVFWWTSVGYSRVELGRAIPFRYEFVGSALVILALIPERTPEALRHRVRRAPAAVGAILVAAVMVVVNGPSVVDSTHTQQRAHDAIRAQLIAANLGPQVLPDDALIEIGGTLAAGDYRELVDRYGAPGRTQPDHPDAVILELGGVRPIPVATTPGPCQAIGGSPIDVWGSVTLRGGREPTRVEVRRFEEGWIGLGTVAPGRDVRIDLPTLPATEPWLLRAEGACRAGIPPTTSIARPEDSAVLSGTVELRASTGGEADVVAVEFRASGGAMEDQLIGTGEATYFGWRLDWDTSSAPNGRYEITSTAIAASGAEGTSEPTTVTVRN